MTADATSHTRAFLFADLRDYAAYAERKGDRAAAQLLHSYRAMVREQIAAFDGAEIRTEGDSFYVVFAAAGQAVRAGLAIRDAAAEASALPGAAPIRVGIGIHAGEVEETADGIVSTAVNIAARVCASAGAGEVLVTDTVRGLTRTLLPIGFTPRGRRRLKGIAEPIAVFAVHALGDVAPAPRLRRPSLIVLEAGAILVTALVMGSVVFMLSNPGRAGHPSGTAQPSRSGSQPPSSAPSIAEVAFPNAAETALLERLPEEITTSCGRADPETVPDRNYATHDGPLVVVAGVNCLTGVTRVVYWQGVRGDDIDSAFAREVGILRVLLGVCGEQSRAWQQWELGVYSGKLLCYSAPETVLEWTYGEEPILAIATRRTADPGDFADFMAWWRDIGRLLSR
jgi:class 3 adenylate cyclase